MQHAVIASCKTIKRVAKTKVFPSFVKCTAFSATTLALHLQRQLWHCICSNNFGAAFAATTLALHLQRQVWNCIPSNNFGSAFAATTLELHLSKCYEYCRTQYIQRNHIHNSENIDSPENTILQIWTI